LESFRTTAHHCLATTSVSSEPKVSEILIALAERFALIREERQELKDALASLFKRERE